MMMMLIKIMITTLITTVMMMIIYISREISNGQRCTCALRCGDNRARSRGSAGARTLPHRPTRHPAAARRRRRHARASPSRARTGMRGPCAEQPRARIHTARSLLHYLCRRSVVACPPPSKPCVRSKRDTQVFARPTCRSPPFEYPYTSVARPRYFPLLSSPRRPRTVNESTYSPPTKKTKQNPCCVCLRVCRESCYAPDQPWICRFSAACSRSTCRGATDEKARNSDNTPQPCPVSRKRLHFSVCFLKKTIAYVNTYVFL